jgi:hypothetical protein
MVETLRKDMALLGHTQDPFDRELTTMIGDRLVLSGNMDNVSDDSNIIRVTPYGTFHLSLLRNITYLSACSEDVLYRDLSVTQRISDRISEKTGDGHMSKTTMIANVEEMLIYLSRYRDEKEANRILLYIKETFLLKPKTWDDIEEDDPLPDELAIFGEYRNTKQ